tara:strand:- start:1004 stop:1318 length:315 start_codon:yes stop_codon:yes gene_type:complete
MLKDFLDKDLENVKKEDIAILYFSATWCAPCQVLKPIMQNLSEEFKDKTNFYYADIDEKAINTASMSGIRGVPTVCIWKKGEEVDRSVGSIPESKMRDFLNKNL